MTKYYTPTRLSENIRETPEGFLICLNVPIARTGVMIYADGETPLESNDDGQVKITRDSKEVFNPDTIASFEGKAVTIRHPEEFVSPENWSDLAKGVIQNVRKAPEKDEDGEESLIADLLITDALAIRLIKSGLREVSCGYEAEYEQTGDGTGKQTHIIGNHLALVEQGRAGESYAINDHKGKTTMSKLAENMKKLFANAVDEATESEKKEKESKDEFDKKDEPKEESKDEGEKMKGYDELVKMCKDMAEKLDSMAKPKDEDKPKEEEKKPEDSDKKEESKDDDMALEERIKALETAVAKLLDLQQGKDEDDMDDDESEDAGYGEEKPKESKDEELKKSEKTGDSKTGLEGTKKAVTQDLTARSGTTAEEMNEINAAFWARK